MHHDQLKAENAQNQRILEAMNHAISAEPFNEVKTICMSDIEMKPIDWLWPDRIASGKITVIAGNPGLGKSQITCKLAASITSDTSWPDFTPLPDNKQVIFLSAEDDPADTIKPRLIAAGADISKCHILESVKLQDGSGKIIERGFDLEQDVARLETTVANIGNVGMVVIDPISAYLGKVDSHNNAAIRGLLMPLSAMASKYNVAVVLLTHLNKSITQDRMARITGSVGLIAAARAGYIVEKDEKDPELRYLLPVKNNIGNDKEGFSYRIETMQMGAVRTSRIVWMHDLVNAHDIFHPSEELAPKSTDEIDTFLRQLLLDENGMMANEVYETSLQAGYSTSQIQRAKKRIGAVAKKVGKDGWQWFMPKSDRFRNVLEDSEGSEDGEDCTAIEALPSFQQCEDSAPPHLLPLRCSLSSQSSHEHH